MENKGFSWILSLAAFICLWSGQTLGLRFHLLLTWDIFPRDGWE